MPFSVKTWSDASAACQSDGGALTSIINVYESGFVVTLAGKKTPYWIGLSDSVVCGSVLALDIQSNLKREHFEIMYKLKIKTYREQSARL